jgi:hypothetical protein
VRNRGASGASRIRFTSAVRVTVADQAATSGLVDLIGVG